MLEITSIAADLMRIFALRHYSSDRYDDTTAIELLKYLQTLAHAEKVPTPKLDHAALLTNMSTFPYRSMAAE